MLLASRLVIHPGALLYRVYTQSVLYARVGTGCRAGLRLVSWSGAEILDEGALVLRYRAPIRARI
eukprot:COSAG02_NODE_6044_length_3846_cov_10.119295_4_plen_64_part_01